ncbi:VRR-NUC domain-containing protein [Spirosoma areae]
MNTALHHLNRLADEAKAAKYPSVRANYIPKSKFDDRTANGLTSCVLEWLKLNSHFCARINTGGIYDEKLRRYRPSGATLGVPDVIGCIRGLFIGIEIKVGSEKLSAEQKDVARQIESSPGYFVEVRSFEQLYSWYENLTRPPFA